MSHCKGDARRGLYSCAARSTWPRAAAAGAGTGGDVDERVDARVGIGDGAGAGAEGCYM